MTSDIRIDENNYIVEVREDVVSVVTVGLQGPAGPGASTYVHTQTVPSATWTITHDLGRYPSVSVVDSAENVIYANVTYTSPSALVVTFSAAFGGKAYLN
jgi:predicted AAA+ superfamily ATPase